MLIDDRLYVHSITVSGFLFFSFLLLGRLFNNHHTFSPLFDYHHTFPMHWTRFRQRGRIFETRIIFFLIASPRFRQPGLFSTGHIFDPTGTDFDSQDVFSTPYTMLSTARARL